MNVTYCKLLIVYKSREEKKNKVLCRLFRLNKAPRVLAVKNFSGNIANHVEQEKKISSSNSFYATNIKKIKNKRKTKIVQRHLDVELKVKIKMNRKRIR